MTIAVPIAGETIYQHFGHTAQFKLYTAQDGSILSSQVMDSPGHGHSATADFLQERHVDVLICGCIGVCAKAALSQSGIRLFGGVAGDVDEAVEAFLSGVLEYDPHIRCTHHENGACGCH